MNYGKSFIMISLLVLLVSVAGVSAGNVDGSLLAGDASGDSLDLVDVNGDGLDAGDCQLPVKSNENALSARADSVYEEDISSSGENSVYEDDIVSSDDGLASADKNALSSSELDSIDVSSLKDNISAQVDSIDVYSLKDNISAQIDSIDVYSLKDNISAQIDSIKDELSSLNETIASKVDEVLDGDSFSALQAKIILAEEGSTITLDKDYKYDDAFSPLGIAIAKNLTIDGNGHTLDGQSKSRILLLMFSSHEEKKITLKNIKFKNGFTNLYGGAIFNYANMTVDNCTFINNHAECCGGAINSVGNAVYKNSVFKNNTAKGDAGAIFTLSLKVSFDYLKEQLENKTFDGSMDFIASLSLNGTLKFVKEYVSNCTFTGNVANGRGGGAIYAFTHIDIKSSTFTSNRAGEHGGAVFACRDLYIKNSKFKSNKAPKYGGAVYFKAHEMSGYYKNLKWISTMNYFTSTIQNSTFTKNSASKGGAIYAFVYNTSNKTQFAKVSKCTFTDNNASSSRDTYGASCKNCVYNYLKLTMKAVTIKKSAKSLVLTATLKKGASAIKGKTITFKFNGKTYKVKTNSKGVAKLTIKKAVLKKLKVGKSIVYKAIYGKLTVKRSAKVKK